MNYRGSGDMYSKGAAMIHTLRQIINNDDKFRNLLRGINKTFYHETISSKQLENYIIEQTGLELKGFFDQYLRSVKTPVFQYKIKNGTLSYRYTNIVDDFSIPVKSFIDGDAVWLSPTKKWQRYNPLKKVSKFELDDNFYIDVKN